MVGVGVWREERREERRRGGMGERACWSMGDLMSGSVFAASSVDTDEEYDEECEYWTWFWSDISKMEVRVAAVVLWRSVGKSSSQSPLSMSIRGGRRWVKARVAVVACPGSGDCRRLRSEGKREGSRVRKVWRE